MRRRTVTAVVAAAAMLAACGTPPPPTAATGAGDEARSPQPPPGPTTTEGALGFGGATETAPAVIASAHGLDLVLPAAGALLVAFHEGSSSASQLTVELPARAVMNAASDTEVARDVGVGVVQAMVLPSRRRAATATSAVDVVVPPSIEILAPVTGRVAAVEEYALYGRHTDVRIVIVPEGRVDLQVTVLHVTGPTVRSGDTVEAGVTGIAEGARPLDVGSQVDRFTVRSWREDPPPHVHLEIRPAG